MRILRLFQGTVIVAQTQVASRLEEHFDEPEVFNPDRSYLLPWNITTSTLNIVLRWLEGPQQLNFSCLPFGYGNRSCIGRSLAETSMMIFLIRVFSTFQVDWLGEDLDCETLLINKPDAPLMFQFKNLD